MEKKTKERIGRQIVLVGHNSNNNAHVHIMPFSRKPQLKLLAEIPRAFFFFFFYKMRGNGGSGNPSLFKGQPCLTENICQLFLQVISAGFSLVEFKEIQFWENHLKQQEIILSISHEQICSFPPSSLKKKKVHLIHFH